MVANKHLIFIIFLSLWNPAISQSYIWEYSDNYQKEVNNPEFCYTYKIDGFWRQTYVYYEMVDRSHFNNEIELVNTNYDTSWGFLPLQMNIDGKDTLILLTRDSSVCNLVCYSVPSQISFKIPTRLNKVFVPINEKEIPSKITILCGYNDGAGGILTIRSKRKLDKETLVSIQRDISEGKYPAHHGDYYYYISDM